LADWTTLFTHPYACWATPRRETLPPARASVLQYLRDKFDIPEHYCVAAGDRWAFL